MYKYFFYKIRMLMVINIIIFGNNNTDMKTFIIFAEQFFLR